MSCVRGGLKPSFRAAMTCGVRMEAGELRSRRWGNPKARELGYSREVRRSLLTPPLSILNPGTPHIHAPSLSLPISTDSPSAS